MNSSTAKQTNTSKPRKKKATSFIKAKTIENTRTIRKDSECNPAVEHPAVAINV
jgi:hypothetical protein